MEAPPPPGQAPRPSGAAAQPLRKSYRTAGAQIAVRRGGVWKWVVFLSVFFSCFLLKCVCVFCFVLSVCLFLFFLCVCFLCALFGVLVGVFLRFPFWSFISSQLPSVGSSICRFRSLESLRPEPKAKPPQLPPLRVQTPPKKVFWGGFGGLNPFSGGIWTLRAPEVNEKEPRNQPQVLETTRWRYTAGTWSDCASMENYVAPRREVDAHSTEEGWQKRMDHLYELAHRHGGDVRGTNHGSMFRPSRVETQNRSEMRTHLVQFYDQVRPHLRPIIEEVLEKKIPRKMAALNMYINAQHCDEPLECRLFAQVLHLELGGISQQVVIHKGHVENICNCSNRRPQQLKPSEKWWYIPIHSIARCGSSGAPRLWLLGQHQTISDFFKEKSYSLISRKSLCEGFWMVGVCWGSWYPSSVVVNF